MTNKLEPDTKMFNFSLTNPGKEMLLGFNLQHGVMRGIDDGEIMGSLDIFSIGLFFCRIDIFFNDTMSE